jgi:hypothetical protein
MPTCSRSLKDAGKWQHDCSVLKMSPRNNMVENHADGGMPARGREAQVSGRLPS